MTEISGLAFREREGGRERELQRSLSSKLFFVIDKHRTKYDIVQRIPCITVIGQ